MKRQILFGNRKTVLKISDMTEASASSERTQKRVAQSTPHKEGAFLKNRNSISCATGGTHLHPSATRIAKWKLRGRGRVFRAPLQRGEAGLFFEES